MATKHSIWIVAKDKTQAAFKSASKGAKGLDKDVSKLGRSFGTVAVLYFGAQAVKYLSNTTDAYRRMGAQLRLVTESEGEAAAVRQDLLELSQRTRSEMEGTVIAYARMSRAVAELGVSQKDLLIVSEALNQSFRISGATQKESYNATIQLSQGLASGALRGEEYNAIAEQAPRIMKALRDEYSKTDGELRAMSKKGQITSLYLLDALKNQSVAIGAEFALLPVLVSESMIRLSNATQNTFGKIDMAPIIAAIQDLEAMVSDPAFEAAAITIGNAFVYAVGGAERLITILPKLGIVIGETAGAAASGDGGLIGREKRAQEIVDNMYPDITGVVLGRVDQYHSRIGHMEKELKAANDEVKRLFDIAPDNQSRVSAGFEGMASGVEMPMSGQTDIESHAQRISDAIALVGALEAKLRASAKSFEAAKKELREGPIAPDLFDKEANDKAFAETRTAMEKWHIEFEAMVGRLGGGQVKDDIYIRKLDAFAKRYEELQKKLSAPTDEDKAVNKLLDQIMPDDEKLKKRYDESIAIIESRFSGDEAEKIKKQIKDFFYPDVGGSTAFAQLKESLRTDAEAAAAEYKAGLKIITDAGLEDPAAEEMIDRLRDSLYPEDEGFWEQWVDSATNAITDVDTLAANMMESFSSGMGDMAVQTIMYSESAREAWSNMARGMMESVIFALGETAAQWVALQIVQLATGKVVATSAAVTMTAEAQAMSHMAAINSYASAAAIPITGWIAAPGAAAAAYAATQPMAAAVASLSVAAIAHGGLDNVPAESTYLLQKGERVLSPNQNRDLVNFMGDGGSGNNDRPVVVNININAMDTDSAARVIHNQRGQIVSVIRSAFNEAGQEVAI